MPRMPNNEDGHVLNATLLVYNADTWTDQGKREFAKWLREKAKHFTKKGETFTPRVKIQRWSVDESPAPAPTPTPAEKKKVQKPRKLDLKATPNAVKEGRVKVRARQIMKERPKVRLSEAAKSTPRSKFAVAPYASGQRLRVKRAGG
jgi:hypothetical protein